MDASQSQLLINKARKKDAQAADIVDARKNGMQQGISEPVQDRNKDGLHSQAKREGKRQSNQLLKQKLIEAAQTHNLQSSLLDGQSVNNNLLNVDNINHSTDAGAFDLLDQGMGVNADPADFSQFPAYQNLLLTKLAAEQLQLPNPFYKTHEGLASDTTKINGRSYINYSSYNYLGLNEDPRLLASAKQAIDTYGVSCSASRLVSGERPVQRDLETALADLHQTNDAAVFVSGHSTNVTVLGYLFTKNDLIIHDSLIHNSVIEGIKLSGATRLSFPHNDWRELDAILQQRRDNFERVLIVVEGLYSMEGDFPDLPKMIAIKQRYQALLMVDEAHSVGVLGDTGKGIAEHYSDFGISDCSQVDIWMGTLSKTFSSCGGYIAGNQALIDMLKSGAPGYLFSVGISPALAATALTALQILQSEPQRVHKLRSNAALFDKLARAQGIDTGSNQQAAIIPVMTGGSVPAVRLAERLFEHGINVQPILHPAVEERLARLRFFICSSHSEEQIIQTVDTLAEAMRDLALLQ